MYSSNPAVNAAVIMLINQIGEPSPYDPKARPGTIARIVETIRYVYGDEADHVTITVH